MATDDENQDTLCERFVAAAAKGQTDVCMKLTPEFERRGSMCYAAAPLECFKHEARAAIAAAARNCHVKTCVWVAATYLIRKRHSTDQGAAAYVFDQIAVTGVLAACVALVKEYGLTLGNARHGIREAFRAALSRGHLDICEWMAGEFALERTDVGPFEHVFDCFARAAATGNLRMCKWVAGHFGVTRAIARDDGYAARRYAQANGHHQVVEWLTQTYGN